MLESKDVIQLNDRDNVVIAKHDLSEGDQITTGSLTFTLKQIVPQGHKLAIADIAPGSSVIKYGQIIGQANALIMPGEHVHSHNMGMAEYQKEVTFESTNDFVSRDDRVRTFDGYVRADGQVGTRNYIGVLTSVNCAGSVARFICDSIEKSGVLDQFENVDGVIPIVHGTGCGMSGSNDGYDILKRTLLGYASNANFGGILLLGLGCEVMQVSSLVETCEKSKRGAFNHLVIQAEGGTTRTVKRGVEMVKEIATTANQTHRESASVANLIVGMQCGGSDSYSGITANPALGYASDLLVKHGGTSILSETSEIYGAEYLLTSRAVSQETSDKLTSRIQWWEAYCEKHGGELDNNPSPGNKRGGLTTILEKSLGAVAKGGSAPLVDVYQYAEKIDKKGFVFMDSPGYDPCSVTGQVASGANLIVFTTGRGSVSGYKPVPCIKLATNTPMYERLKEDMDLNCGDIVTDGKSIAQKGEELFELIIATASGEQTKSEKLGFGGVEFVPWQIGAVM
ncbi:UxaA family hydrolase [Vibrio amylolyticus]|uniref:UxaA family hydrolase n=1 Tax=Vibrio amylolyticus TaxID=2847292 RepID=UPI00354D0D2F